MTDKKVDIIKDIELIFPPTFLYKKPSIEIVEMDLDLVALTDCTGSSCPSM